MKDHTTPRTVGSRRNSPYSSKQRPKQKSGARGHSMQHRNLYHSPEREREAIVADTRYPHRHRAIPNHCNRSRTDDETQIDPAPLSPARRLLSQVQQVIELETDWLGHKPAIMDVILNLMTPVADHRDDSPSENFEPGHITMLQSLYFADPSSLNAYWDKQAAFWNDVPFASDVGTRFEVSAERSTVSNDSE